MDEEREDLGGTEEGDLETIYDPGQKFEFWKPEVAGQELVGQLLRIKEQGQYGPTLRFKTRDGLMAYAVTEQMADINWKPLVGRTIVLRFLGWIELKHGTKMRNIKVLALRDETPF